jgi:hypothetical protein
MNSLDVLKEMAKKNHTNIYVQYHNAIRMVHDRYINPVNSLLKEKKLLIQKRLQEILDNDKMPDSEKKIESTPDEISPEVQDGEVFMDYDLGLTRGGKSHHRKKSKSRSKSRSKTRSKSRKRSKSRGKSKRK